MKLKFIEYNGIEGYIELMKHDVEPLNNPECKCIELYYDGKDIKAVLDYITNLQEENKELKKKITFNEKSRRKMQQSLMGQTEDYKTRNEKAIEYINQAIENGEYFEDDISTDIEEASYDKYVNANDLLEILQGKSDE